MMSMRKNHELFFILEMLLLTPIALFWIGVANIFLSGSDNLLMAVVGGDFGIIRGIFVAIVCPVAASWFAFDYIRENKKNKKDKALGFAKAIIALCAATLLLVGMYLLNGSFV